MGKKIISIRRDNWVLLLLWGMLLLELAFIFFVLLNYYFSWISNENDKIHAWVYSNGKAWRWEDWGRFLHSDGVEGDGSADRISRPVCDFVHIVNAKFRAFFWNYIPPHPALSVTWPVCFTLIPVFLYKFFRLQGCCAAVALAGVCLYLGSLGFLTPIVMYVHPAKVLVNICAVLVLWLGSRLSGSLRQWFGFLFFIFFSFFCDESALFIYVMAFFVAAEFIFRNKRRWFFLVSFAFLPLAYFLTIRLLLPYAHYLYEHQAVDLRHYCQYPKFLQIFHAPWWKMFLTNVNLLLYDHPHLQLNTGNLLPYNKPLFFLQVVYTLTAAITGVLFIKALFKKDHPQKRLLQIAGVCAVMVLFMFFNTLLNNLVWGVFYYGALYSLMYFIMLSFIFQFILERDAGGLLKKFFPFVVLVFMLNNLAFTLYRVDFFDTSKMVWTQKYTAEDVFMGRTPEYFRDFGLMDGIKKSDCRYWYTVLAWSKAKGRKTAPGVEDKVERCQPTLQQDQAFFAGTPYWAVEI